MTLRKNHQVRVQPTSGVLTIFPSDHIRAPYTLISCCVSIWSALLSTTLAQDGSRTTSKHVQSDQTRKWNKQNSGDAAVDMCNSICSQPAPDLVLVVLQGLDDFGELVGNVQFVGVKQ